MQFLVPDHHDRSLALLEAGNVEPEEQRFSVHGFGLDFAWDGEGGDGVEDGEWRAPLAGRGQVTDANLVVWELEGLVLCGEDLGFSQARVAMEDRGIDPWTTHLAITDSIGKGVDGNGNGMELLSRN